MPNVKAQVRRVPVRSTVHQTSTLGKLRVLVEQVTSPPTQAQINIAVAQYITDHPGAAFGISEEVKQALLQIARKIPYLDDDADYYQDLYDALYAVTAITLDQSSFTLTTIGATQQLTATTVPSGAAVTWTSSNTTVATVSDTGLVTSVAYGTATITATAGTLSATCSVLVSQATVTAITAVYTQSGTVTTTDTLDSLKEDLVVTAYYDNSTSAVISDGYTLSGTLTEGTSTITVSYAGKTATFDVTVTYVPYSSLLYNWNFKSSLVDTVASQEATLSGDFTRTSSGLVMASTGYCELGIEFKKGMAIEVDIVSATAAEAQTQTTMLLQFFSDENVKGLSYGYHGSSTTSNKRWGIIATADVGHWGMTSLTYTSHNVYSGGDPKTVRIEIASDGTVSFYLNGTFYSTAYEGDAAVISTNDLIKNVTIGGKVTYTVSFNACTIGACRVYG